MVRGHTGHVLHDRVDEMAKTARESLQAPNVTVREQYSDMKQEVKAEERDGVGGVWETSGHTWE